MRLNIYLLREDIKDLRSVTRHSYVGAGKARQIEAVPPLPYKSLAYQMIEKEREPRWTKFLTRHFAINPFNAQAGFLLLLEAGGRGFAVSFGSGHLLLDPSAFEPNFGLRVCANVLDAKKLRTIDTRSIDTTTRQARINMSVGSEIRGFEIEIDRNWIRLLSGAPMDEAIGKSLAGSDSVRLLRDVEIHEMGELCEELLEHYEKEGYKQTLSELDRISPLHRHDPLFHRLNRALDERVQRQQFTKLAMAAPTLPEDNEPVVFRFFHSGGCRDYADLSLQHVTDYLSTCAHLPNPLDQVKVIPVDDDEKEVGRAARLRDYLVAEIEIEGRLYLCTAGQWFKLDEDYTKEIRRRVAEIPEISKRIDLPKMKPKEREDDYNRRVSGERDWVHFDKHNFHFCGIERDQKVEVCDLLAHEHHFVCVKKGSKSAPLSHLFAQGAVSMTLLRHEPKYRATAVRQGGAMVREDFNDPRPTVVFAVATEKEGPLSESLFLFSAINLVNQLRTIERADAKVALARIELEVEPNTIRVAARRPSRAKK